MIIIYISIIILLILFIINFYKYEFIIKQKEYFKLKQSIDNLKIVFDGLKSVVDSFIGFFRMIFEQIMSFFRLLTSQINKLKEVKKTLENGPKKTVDFAKKQYSTLKKDYDDLKKKLDKVINTKKIAQRFLDESKQSFENLKKW